MDEVVVERVLRIIELIPKARAVSYGTVGIVASCSPRYVGRVMKEFGSNVHWWKVVDVAGKLPEALLPRAHMHWDDEDTPHTGAKVDRSALITVDELDELWRSHGIEPESS